jgi:hypothetical protein
MTLRCAKKLHRAISREAGYAAVLTGDRADADAEEASHIHHKYANLALLVIANHDRAITSRK